MQFHRFAATLSLVLLAAAGLAQQGQYKILKRARVGTLGGWDYIYADAAGRRLYIPRGPVTGEKPIPARVTVFNLDTLEPVAEIPNIRANGAAVDVKSGHGFASSKPVAMWDTKTLKLIRTIDLPEKNAPDGILADSFNQRVYVFSHPTQDATVIDARTGGVLGTIDLGGVPEQGVSDGKGHVYVINQDKANIAVIDARTMKVTAHYPLEDKGSRCNGLAMDARNHVLFAACAQSGIPPVTPAKPQMVILNATTGKIITSLPLAGGSDGAVFNPATMEAFSTHGNGTLTVIKENSPTSFVVEQNLETMNGARTVTLDRKTNHILTMSSDWGPPPPAEPGKAAPARGAMLPGTFTILMVGK